MEPHVVAHAPAPAQLVLALLIFFQRKHQMMDQKITRIAQDSVSVQMDLNALEVELAIATMKLGPV